MVRVGRIRFRVLSLVGCAWFVCFGVSAVARAQDAYWAPIDLGIGDDLYDVFFVDQDRGWLVGQGGLILYTTSGGESAADWLTPTGNPATVTLRKVFFLDNGSDGWAVGEAGVVLVTDDGGDTWNEHAYHTPTTPSFASVFFLDASNGWAASATNVNQLWRTQTGAGGCQPVTELIEGLGQDVAFDGAGNGWFVVTDAAGWTGLVYKTDNGGDSWFASGLDSAIERFFAVGISTPSNVWVVGESGAMFRGPSPWQPAIHPTAHTLRDVGFARTDSAHGWAVGDGGTILGTPDGGDNWGPVASGVSVDLLGVAAYGPKRAWAVGRSGTYVIYRECINDSHCSGTVVGCVDNGACDPQSHTCGVVFADDAPCDDGLYCTESDTCLGGVCNPGPDRDCSQVGDQCNRGVCDDVADDCVAQPTNESQACDDGSYCTLGERCQAGLCTGGQPRDCSAYDGPCEVGRCDEMGETCYAEPVADGNVCSDDDACTVGDECRGGVCISGANSPNCDDDNPCTDDTCHPQDGCLHDPNTEPCDDGDPCSLGDVCIDGACRPGPGSLECGDDDECTLDWCQPGSGCRNDVLPDGSECGSRSCEGLAWVRRLCYAGNCDRQEVVQRCDDDVDCTADACEPVTGCAHTPDSSRCDDGDACTSDRCDTDRRQCVSEPVADGGSCGICRVCKDGGCVQADARKTCADANGCHGLCDAGGVCVVEVECEQSPPGCDQPAVPYGAGVDCRLPLDALDVGVRMTAVRPDAGGFVPLRVRLRNNWNRTLGGLFLRLDLDVGRSVATYVQRSAVALTPGLKLVETYVSEEGEVIWRLGAEPAGLPAGPGERDEWVVELMLVDQDGVDPLIALDAWTACMADHETPGCHFGFAGEREDLRRPLGLDGGDVDLQRICASVSGHLSSEVSSEQGSLDELNDLMLGCQCGRRSTGLGWIWSIAALFFWWMRRKRTTCVF